MYLILLGIIVLAAGLVIVRRKRSIGDDPADVEPDSTARTKSSTYHAVSVRLGESACLAAKTIEGKRFLAAEAPPLPLAECSSADDCRCRFVHHEDRRSSRDRRSPFAPGSASAGTARFERERREGKDRRRGSSDG